MKFASNLGSSPLEPMKILQPTVAVTCASTATPLNPTKASVPKSTKPTIDVPAAQFDWNSSGLTNPLDGNVKRLPIFICFCFCYSVVVCCFG